MRVSKFDRRICRFLLDGTHAEAVGGADLGVYDGFLRGGARHAG